jgi:type IV fimbrial biogenesis protein FimT
VKPLRTHGCRAGFTLVELAITVAVLSMVAASTLPSWTSSLLRHRLKATAERLAADMTEARFEAARSGQPLYLSFDVPQRCWAVASTPQCSCAGQATCARRHAQFDASDPVQWSQAHSMVFEPAQVQPASGGTTLQVSGHAPLLVSLTALGRARICAPNGGWVEYPSC